MNHELLSQYVERIIEEARTRHFGNGEDFHAALDDQLNDLLNDVLDRVWEVLDEMITIRLDRSS